MRLPLEKIVDGAWEACWGAWQVTLRSSSAGWTVEVWQRSPARGAPRHLLGKARGHDTAVAAVDWACEVIRAHGGYVFINGQKQSMKAFLAFTQTLLAA